ncbi:MAG: PQQ-binding-like beta-propeller repeat protein [Pirellulaceae bacterium]
MLVTQKVFFGIIATLAALNVASAQDWPQWQGEDRDGVWHETGTLTAFPKDGPNILWRVPIANGYSGPAVSNGCVFVLDFVRTDGDPTPNPGKKSELTGSERVHCLDAKSGDTLWSVTYDCQYKFSYPNGPRATPTVDSEHVYTLGAEGMLHCLRCEDGEVVWKKDLKQDYQLELAPHWGFAAHPLVDGDQLYCIVGTEDNVVVAFEKNTGEELWSALSARSQGYCPPTMIEAGGTKQLLVWHPESLNSLNPETGEVYWSFEMQPAYDMSIVAPIKYGDYLYTTALQGTSLLLKLDENEPKATEVWRGHGTHPDHNPPLIVDGHIYGVDEAGQFRCVNLETGDRVWESMETATNGRPNNSTTGFIVKCEDHYYIMTEQGELLIAKLSPEKFDLLDRAKILEPTTQTSNRRVVWSHPAFAQKCMFARNDKEIVCVSLEK